MHREEVRFTLNLLSMVLSMTPISRETQLFKVEPYLSKIQKSWLSATISK